MKGPDVVALVSTRGSTRQHDVRQLASSSVSSDRSALVAPSAALQRVVRAFYWHDLPPLDGLPLANRLTYVPPGPYAALVWLVAGRAMLVSCGGQAVERELPAVFAAGAHRHPFRSMAMSAYRSFGIAFQPGALAGLAGQDAAPPVDGIVNAHTFLPQDWHGWLDDVARAEDHMQRVAISEAFLAPRAAALRPSDRNCWPLAARAWTRPAQQALLSAMNWTQRHLQRRTRALVGLTPGEVDRLLRLERALLDVRDGRSGRAEAAVAWGFADQSHFTRETRTWFGRSPGELQRQINGPAADGDWLMRL